MSLVSLAAQAPFGARAHWGMLNDYSGELCGKLYPHTVRDFFYAAAVFDQRRWLRNQFTAQIGCVGADAAAFTMDTCC